MSVRLPEQNEDPWSPVEVFYIYALPLHAVESFVKHKVKTKTARGERVSTFYDRIYREKSSPVGFYTKLVKQYDKTYSGTAGFKSKDFLRRALKVKMIGSADNEGRDIKDYFREAKKIDQEYKGAITHSHLKTMPDLFVVEIGIIDKATLHEGITGVVDTVTEYDKDGNIERVDKSKAINGEDMDYEKLFGLLYHLGFDPLSVIRHRRLTIQNLLTKAVNQEIARGNFSKKSILRVLDEEVSELDADVHDYIDGAKAPKLAESTVKRYRPMKLEIDSSLYNRGINSPLYETGQLYDALGYRIRAFQSDNMKKYLNDIRKAIMSDRQRDYDRLYTKYKREVGVQPLKYSAMLGIKTRRNLEKRISKILITEKREKIHVDREESFDVRELMLAEKISKARTCANIIKADFDVYMMAKKEFKNDRMAMLDFLYRSKISESDVRIMEFVGAIYDNLI